MKKILYLLFLGALSTTMSAQTMNVVTGDVIYQFPAAQTGEMTYSDGTSLVIQGKSFVIGDITKIFIDNSEVTDNTIGVFYDGNKASVIVAGNVAQYVTPIVNGAHVTIEQNDEISEEITYRLSGFSSDGEFYQSGSYKSTIELCGLSLTNASGAPITIQNGKRIAISVKKDTENTLTDYANGSHKACLVVKGHTEFKGKGTLNIHGKTGHGIKSGEYMSVKNCTINILSAEKDGIHCNEYFLLESGVVSIENVGDDAIQTELDGTTSTGMTDDQEDEDTGNIYLTEGTLTLNVSAAAAKGLKAAGDIYIYGGIVSATTSGEGLWDSDDKKTKASACLDSEGKVQITGGSTTLASSGAGGKGISADGQFIMTAGELTITTTGGIVAYSNGTLYNGYTGNADRLNPKYKSSPKGIKCEGDLNISGGVISVNAKNHEGIESKGVINITEGHIYSYSRDDAINSGGEMNIEGGYVCGYSTGNDGIDANGNCNIKGGVIYAIGSNVPEVGIDANTEGGYKLYFSGGTLVAIGGLERGSSLTQTCYSSSSWSKSTWYALYNNGELALSFKTPSSGGNTLVVSTSSSPSLKSGVTVTGGTEYFEGMAVIGGSVSGGNNVNLSQYSPSGGGGPGPGGGGWH